MRRIVASALSIWLTIFMLLVPLAHASDDVSAITEPLNRIYDLVKAIISVVATSW